MYQGLALKERGYLSQNRVDVFPERGTYVKQNEQLFFLFGREVDGMLI